MRFGLVPLEFEPIVKRILSRGILDFSRFDIVEYVRSALEVEHISVIELTADIQNIIPGSLSGNAIDRLNKLKDEKEHTYTVHLPLWSLELATFNDHVRNGSVESVVSTINFLAPLEPEVYVLHSTGALATEFSQLNFPQEMVNMINMQTTAYSAKSIEEIITRTEIDPKQIAIENLEFPFDFTRDVVDEYNTSICFDTGHLLSKQSGDESVLEFYMKHKDKISELHLHDGKASEPGVKGFFDHKALGTGDMPIREFLMELLKNGFDGPLIFELTAEEAIASLKKIEELVPEAL
ncbi:MAG: cobamide remodeling phosphodiesterase CbiR [Candidatus Thorarchaeota archaeon]|nr:cobamide remodeling phosphodiesterase CbiR [Candidatus Thorarchaeota archaeon]